MNLTIHSHYHVTLFFILSFVICSFFFFNDTATTEIYTLSLHDALPIGRHRACLKPEQPDGEHAEASDRKSTRLNSSHDQTSYAVFCLKKKKKNIHKKFNKKKKTKKIKAKNKKNKK